MGSFYLFIFLFFFSFSFWNGEALIHRSPGVFASRSFVLPSCAQYALGHSISFATYIPATQTLLSRMLRPVQRHLN